MAEARRDRALGATRTSIALPTTDERRSETPADDGSEPIRMRGRRSSPDIANAINQLSQKTSPTSGKPSADSKRPWKQPQTAHELAVQANHVATRVLNGEIDIETARAYSTIARVVAQMVGAEVSRSRFLKQSPDLNLGLPDLDDE